MHPEALTSGSKKIWPRLKEFSEFVLAGGTALAIQIGHRISVDFDFFSERELEPSLLDRVERTFQDSTIKTIINVPEQLTVSIDGINLTFLTYRFPRQHPTIEWEGVRLLSVPDIAATKAYAIGRRATLKDYVDLYSIVTEGHLALEEIMRVSGKTYGENFEPRLFLEQLVYLKDVPEEPIRFLKRLVSKTAVEKFFEAEITKIRLI